MHTHSPIKIASISLAFGAKVCFEDFSSIVYCRDKIGIVGDNGVGKSSLLKVIANDLSPTTGGVVVPNDVMIGAVPQIIEEQEHLSGGERFLQSLSYELGKKPNVLLLDEPTNHLDQDNRKSLLGMLNRFSGTLLVVSHDQELLSACINKVWMIKNKQIQIFAGNYQDLLLEENIARKQNNQLYESLQKKSKQIRKNLMAEQKRAAKSGRVLKNTREKSKAHRNKMKETADKTAGKKKGQILAQKASIQQGLNNFTRLQIIQPTFTIDTVPDNQLLINIVDGSIAYQRDKIILSDIYLSVNAKDRLLISGKNGSGKTSLLKAMMADPSIIQEGDWMTPKNEVIGYLDQHYSTLDGELSVYENMHQIVPEIPEKEIRKILSTFLFQKNEAVQTLAKNLSGGERARLSLAQISVKTPKLLILDEITNNLDITTQAYVLQVLQNFPSAIIVVSHDAYFVKNINITQEYKIDGSATRE